MSVSPRLLQHLSVNPSGRYRAPQYEPVAGEVWHHVLYGHVPKHQMDYILRPVVPYHRLRPQHLAHLGGLIKFLAPTGDDPYAFAIGNLSCDDTQHLPGRGGLALMVGTRIPGLRDHALRDSPVFAHSLLCIDQRLEPQLLHSVAVRFKERVLNEGMSWYSSYYGVGQPDQGERTLSYVRTFSDLPVPELAAAPPVWFQEAPPPYNLIYVECGIATFEEIAWYAARLAAVLYRTSLRWTSISTGSEPVLRKTFDGDEYGVAIRLLRANRQAPARVSDDPCVEPGAPLRLLRVGLADLDCTDEDLALRLFGLPPADSHAVIPEVPAPWLGSDSARLATPPAVPGGPAVRPDPPERLATSSPPQEIAEARAESAHRQSPKAQDATPMVASSAPVLVPAVRGSQESRRLASLAMGSGLLGMALGALAFWLLRDGPGAKGSCGDRNRTAAMEAADLAAGAAGFPPLHDTGGNAAPPVPTPGRLLSAGDPPSESADRLINPSGVVNSEGLVRVVSLQAEQYQHEVDSLNRQMRSGGARSSSMMNDERLQADVDQADAQLKGLRRVLAQSDAIAKDQLATRIFTPLCEATISLRAARRRIGQSEGGKPKPPGKTGPHALGSARSGAASPGHRQDSSGPQQPIVEHKSPPTGATQSAIQ